MIVINLIIASSVEASTLKYGATRIKLDDDILADYLTTIVIKEIKEEKERPILKAQCMKFIMIYRNYIPHDWIIDIIKHVALFLNHESNVLRNYSACVIEKFLSMKLGYSRAPGSEANNE